MIVKITFGGIIMGKFIKKYRQSIITLIVIIVIIASCQFVSLIAEVLDLHIYIGWKKVYVNNSFSIKVPESWELGDENGLLYFYDPNMRSNEDSDYSHNGNIMLFQSKLNDMFEIGDSVKMNKNKIEKNILSDNFQSVVSLSSAVNSLGAISGESIISVDDITYRKNYILFNDDSNDYLFYTWNERLDLKTLEKIADSVEFTH